jgi:hypothetical protein
MVGSLLHDDDVALRGTAQVQRSQALAQAVRLEATAAQQKAEADDELRVKRGEATAAPGKAREEAQKKVQKARTAAEQHKQQKTVAAAKRTAAVKEQIDESADAKVDAAESRRRTEDQRISAAEKSAAAVADAQLDDAADKRKQAVVKQAHADRVEDLAEEEKRQRRTERAANKNA